MTVIPWFEAAHASRIVSGEWIRWVKRKGDAVQVIELWECVAHHSLGACVSGASSPHDIPSSGKIVPQGFWRTVTSHPLSSQAGSFAVLVLFGRVWTMNVELLCS